MDRYEVYFVSWKGYELIDTYTTEADAVACVEEMLEGHPWYDTDAEEGMEIWLNGELYRDE